MQSTKTQSKSTIAYRSKNRCSEHELNQDVETEIKNCKYLSSVYMDNLHLMMKGHRQCFGQMDFHYKNKGSKQQQMDNNFEKIYQRHHCKIVKENLNKNAHARKSYEEYFIQYKDKFQIQSLPTEEHKSTQPIQFHLSQRNLQHKQSDTYKKSFIFADSISPKKRPLSSSLKCNYEESPSPTLIALPQNTNTFLLKMKTITSCGFHSVDEKNEKKFGLGLIHTENRDKDDERVNKIFIGKRTSAKEGISFAGNEIFIQDRIHRARKSVDYSSTQTSFYNNSRCYRKISVRQPYKKSIDQIEKQKIQNKIFMVNSVLSVNIPTSQGYKPKTKCWQNFFQ